MHPIPTNLKYSWIIELEYTTKLSFIKNNAIKGNQYARKAEGFFSLCRTLNCFTFVSVNDTGTCFHLLRIHFDFFIPHYPPSSIFNLNTFFSLDLKYLRRNTLNQQLCLRRFVSTREVCKIYVFFLLLAGLNIFDWSFTISISRTSYCLLGRLLFSSWMCICGWFGCRRFGCMSWTVSATNTAWKVADVFDDNNGKGSVLLFFSLSLSLHRRLLRVTCSPFRWSSDF